MSDLNTKIYVLFHHPCSDGFGAKYAAWKKFGDSAIYLGVNYDKPMPELESGSEVYIVDFSYSKEQLRALNARMKKLLVLDHHKTAQEALAGEPYAIFDMNRSGAVMAWEYFHPEKPVPDLLQIIQDRDLWKWKIPGSNNVLNYLEVHGDDVTTWDEILPLRGFVYRDGEIISRYQERLIDKAISRDDTRIVNIDGHRVILLNSTVFPSEIGSSLCQKHSKEVDYSITYTINANGVACLSLRSIGDFDVSKIALKYGGGGHRNAAGARVSLAKLQEWLN